MTRYCSLFAKILAFVAVLLVGMAGYTSKVEAKGSDADCAAECFVLTSMSIQGVSSYSLSELASTYEGNLARRVGINDLVQTADAITARYRHDGYFLSRAVVAQPDPASGTAYIVVYEGYLGAITVDGTAADAVAPVLEPLKDGRTLTIRELDRRLALASDIPGVRLTSRIEPMLDDPSKHRLVVTADLDRVEGGVYADNRGSEAQGPWQAYVTASVNSTVLSGDRLTVSVLSVPEAPKELTFGELSYSAPLGDGTRIRASVSGYTTDAPAGSSNWIGGQSEAASLAVTHALVRSRNASLWATASLDVREVTQTYEQLGEIKEQLTVARFAASGRRKLGTGYVSASAQLSQGLDWFGATTTPSPQLTRADATGEFTKATATLSAYQDLGRFAGVYVEASAQWSPDPLLASEEFYVGGPNVGRAYNYGELSGDTGMAGVVELRVGWDPQPAAISFAQAYAFFDAGQVTNYVPTGDVHNDLASAGFGARITFKERATVKFELAKPISRQPSSEPDRGWRAFFSLSKEF